MRTSRSLYRPLPLATVATTAVLPPDVAYDSCAPLPLGCPILHRSWYKKYTPQECARLCSKIHNFYGKSCTHFSRQWIKTSIPEHSDSCGRDGEAIADDMPAHGAFGSAGIGAGVWSSPDELAGGDDVERSFAPAIDDAERAQRCAKWDQAVQCSLNWA